MTIPIIDLFAGPGGLGEGFSATTDRRNRRSFRIALSIEKDAIAHRTLELRAFFRQFDAGEAPDAYYDYLRGNLSRDELFSKYEIESRNARHEAWHAELGGPLHSHDAIDARIRKALPNRTDPWVLIGGPPCQAYSLVGRARIIGGSSRAEYEQDHRHFLYREYLRIIAEHRPSVFVMENVKGLISASIQNVRLFEQILQDLEEPTRAINGGARKKPLTYRLFPISTGSGDLLGRFNPCDFIVRCENLGIPQTRHRVIIVGIRSDISSVPTVIHAREHPPILKDAIGDLPRIRSGLSKEEDSAHNWVSAISELRKARWWSSQPVAVRSELDRGLEMLDSSLDRGSEFLKGSYKPKLNPRWFHDKRLKGVLNHSSRSHIRADLHRYFYSSTLASVRNESPDLRDFPIQLLPAHRNVEEALSGGKFTDRFRVQLEGRPASTITSHISKDGHYFIHYDPVQCRSLSVREAARIQTFPDNYFFEGKRTDQYHQVGNAVPPLLALEIARIINCILG